MTEHLFKNIVYEKDNETGIVQITLNRPEIKNALTMLVLLDWYDAMEMADQDDTVKGIIITGAGKDGAEGMRHVKGIGGITIAQDQTTSPVSTMPKAAYETRCVDYVLTPEEIADMLMRIFGSSLVLA